ncbi:MAG: hypothetical protein ACUVX9_07100 [Anaerolineae bacterium]
MVSMTLQNGKFVVAQGAESQRTFTLSPNALRKVFLFMPAEHGHRCTTMTVGQCFANLDDLSDVELAELLAGLPGSKEDRAGFRLLLESYLGHCLVLSLADVDESGIDVLAELVPHRQERRQRVVDWVRHGLGLVVTGALGDSAMLNPQGVRRNAGPLMAWEDLDRVEVEPNPQEGLDMYRFVPKRGCASRELWVRMPQSKAEPFMAEYAFWHALAMRQGASCV